MSLKTKQMGGVQEVVDNRSKDVFVTSSTTVTTKVMALYENVVRIVLTSAKSITVTLPSVKEARGMIYDVTVVTDGGGGAAMTVADKNDDAAWTSLVMGDVADYVTVYSDGFAWRTLCTQNDAS